MTAARPSLPLLAALAALTAAAGPALAQYKVVGPDGSITYTDRPPLTAPGKVSALNRRGAPPEAPSPESDLPFELRQAAARYPVTLYTTADCTPCDSARALLQQRGVPYAERRVATDEDILALERTVGGRTVPSVTIGGQALRGLTPGDWTAYLDAAGYPRESRLPRNWKPAPPAPLTERRNATAPAPAATAEAAPPAAEPVPDATPPSSIRF